MSKPNRLIFFDENLNITVSVLNRDGVSKTATNQFLKFAVLGFNKTREMHEAKIISIGMFCSIFQKRYSAFSTVFIFYLFYTT